MAVTRMLLLIFLLWPLSPSLAQSPVALGTSDSDQTISHSMAFRVDEAASLTAEEVLAHPEGFQPFKAAEANFGYTAAAVWAQLYVDTSAAKNEDYVLSFLDPTLSRVEGWVVYPSGRVAHHVTGGSIHIKDRPLHLRATAIPFETHERGVVRMVIRATSYAPVDLAAIVSPASRFLFIHQWASVLLGLFYGMLYAFLIHHIFLYLTTRDRSYLPFCALLAVFTVSSPMSDGAAEFVGAVQYWGGGGRFLTTGGSNIFIASLLLTASYFDMKNTMRRTYYVLLALVATFAVLSVAQIHPALGRKLGPFILALTGLVSFFEIGIGITMWLRGYKPAALWVAAWMSFETGSVVFVASLLGMLPRNIFTCYAPHWSILGLTILLSLGLGVRVRWLMNDHEEALNDVERFSRKMNEMRNLVRILCHDMATPLTVILSKAEKGLAEVQDPLTREAWQAVMQAAKLEREIMEHVARLESFDRTYSEDTIKSISVEEALKQTVYVFETAIRNKNLSIHTKVHGSSDLTIETDPLILTQTLLGNLVSNAVKFTRRGGQIHLSAHDEGEYLRFRVADNGIGLGEMSSAKGVISKPGSARLGTEGETGSGLGLSLVRSYIEKFGGRLELSSLPGTEAVARGTVVEMWLPRKFHEKSHEPVRLKGLRRQLA